MMCILIQESKGERAIFRPALLARFVFVLASRGSGRQGGAARRKDCGLVHAPLEPNHVRVPRERSSSSRFGVSHQGAAVYHRTGRRSDRSMARLNRAVESHGRGEERAVGRLEVPPGGPRFACHAPTWCFERGVVGRRARIARNRAHNQFDGSININYYGCMRLHTG